VGLAARFSVLAFGPVRGIGPILKAARLYAALGFLIGWLHGEGAPK
jgi:hypothetical protein